MRNLRIFLGVLVTTIGTLLAGCEYRSPVETPRVLTTVRLSLAENQIEVHQETAASAVVLDQNGAPIVAAGQVIFTSTVEEVAVVNPTTGRIFALSPGSTKITASIDGITDRLGITVFMAPIRVNEVDPNGDAPGGWVELFNPTADAVDMADWTLTAADVFQSFTLPPGTTIPAGGFLVVDEATFPLGLRAADTVHLFSRFGVQVDAFAWTSNPASSFGRCPDGTGAFVNTLSATPALANACARAAGLQAPLLRRMVTTLK